MAIEDSGLVVSEDNADQVGVYIGSGIGGLPAIEHYHKVLLEKGPGRVSPFFIPMVIINLASGQVSMRLGARGPNSCAVTACATGNHCIGDAFRLIERGDADVMIAGGAEAAITPLCVAGFASARALSTRNDQPEQASRPFDKERDGFVLGEGAGVLVLEELELARRRGGRMYAEIVGYGMTADAYHITAPPEDGHGAVRCMRRALEDAALLPDAIGYVNAHATSTMADRIETSAVKQVFGDHARRLAVSSTKSMTGTSWERPAAWRRSSACWLSTAGYCHRPSTRRCPIPSAIWTMSPMSLAGPRSTRCSPTPSASAGSTPA